MTALITALTLILTPGGHGHLKPNGWLYAQTGHTPAGTAATYTRTNIRGLNIKIHEDGSLTIHRNHKLILTACIKNKGCKIQ